MIEAWGSRASKAIIGVAGRQGLLHWRRRAVVFSFSGCRCSVTACSLLLPCHHFTIEVVTVSLSSSAGWQWYVNICSSYKLAFLFLATGNRIQLPALIGSYLSWKITVVGLDELKIRSVQFNIPNSTLSKLCLPQLPKVLSNHLPCKFCVPAKFCKSSTVPNQSNICFFLWHVEKKWQRQRVVYTKYTGKC